MSDLNVKTVKDMSTGDVINSINHGKISFKNGIELAHLFAQAKNMYEMLEDASRGIKQMSIADSYLYDIADDIDNLLNACKPPEGNDE